MFNKSVYPLSVLFLFIVKEQQPRHHNQRNKKLGPHNKESDLLSITFSFLFLGEFYILVRQNGDDDRKDLGLNSMLSQIK